MTIRRHMESSGQSGCITVIGSFVTDLVITSAEFVKEGETILGDSFHQYPGGKGVNQAVAAARLGGRVSMIGKLGNDAFGRQQVETMEANGVNHEHVLFTDEAPSGVGNPQIDSHGRNRIVVIPGANMTFTSAEVEELRSVIAGSDIIVLQLEIPIDTVYAAIRIAHDLGRTVILNPAPAAVVSQAYAPMVDWLVPNQHEAELLTGVEVNDVGSAREAATILSAAGYRNILITLGEQGAYLRAVDGTETVSEAFRMEQVVDTVAAGDSYIGALAYGLSNGWEPARCMRYASAASALAVTRPGAIPSLPSRDEVDEFLRSRCAD
ncbi:ribokinase [Bifidobacterium margollesii]|uniref:Ribokinase n=1 Tax=Bifidobacterium margollesii TaxID=2020964 RepID=A0A2N5JAP1_9BIFI|nr:ribokinase [Bifidobacterium margollesii]PLS31283.1 ribokinase [Bifidobacterium margollesii]